MYISSSTMRTIAWTTLAFSGARAQYIIDNLSFGHKDGQGISPNLRGIPHFATNGDGYEPEILSDRVILTPPYPGSKRGAIWSEDPLHHAGDWTAELQFRASGMERGGGNLQLWYTRDSQKGQTPNSLYTAPQFDGLVLVIDQYEGRGGSVRGFLNDGSIDIKAHMDSDTLAFGQCSYAYRNLGRFSALKVHHRNGIFEVFVDGSPCFSTDKVRLPEGYYFGITASSAENPDSFEIHRFTVSTANAYTREEPNMQQKQEPMGGHHQQQANQQQQQQQQQRQAPKSGEPAIGDIPQMLSDVLAGSIRSSEDQFADLHYRIQIVNHQVNLIYEIAERMDRENKERLDNVMNRIVGIDDKVNAMIRNVEKIERTSMETLRDLESKDFKNTLHMVHEAIQNSHSTLSANMPLTMAQIAGSHRPSMTTYLFIAVAVQIMILGAYRLYKMRRNSAPKKYL